MVPESPILATSIIVVTIEAEHIYLCIVKKSLYFSCISHCHVHNPKYSAQAKAKSSLCNFIPSLHGNEHFINSVEKQNGKAAARLALEEVHVRVFYANTWPIVKSVLCKCKCRYVTVQLAPCKPYPLDLMWSEKTCHQRPTSMYPFIPYSLWQIVFSFLM